jgi:hypothetical protein
MITKGSRVELVADSELVDAIGGKKLKVSSKNPCKGTVRATRYRKYGNTTVKLVTFCPDICPDNGYEFSLKNFREIKEG